MRLPRLQAYSFCQPQRIHGKFQRQLISINRLLACHKTTWIVETP